jgi:hypothetical protein
MQAIETRYCGPTETKGSRIRASCYGGSLYVPYSHELDPEENHYAAATRLCEKLGWKAERYFGGCLASGQWAWVPVFISDWEKRQKEVTNA